MVKKFLSFPRLFSLLRSLMKYDMLTAEGFSYLKNTAKTPYPSWKQNSGLTSAVSLSEGVVGAGLGTRKHAA